jgi:DNA repair exonuclease SbcCD nuclease subunit
MPSRDESENDDDDDDDEMQYEQQWADNLDTSWCSNDDPDTMRILLSTDNHLGYNERDPVRGNDSFAAFEEVLYTARRFHCDFVLLSGDLFHENRPSRRTYHKTMEILRRYCMGPDPVRIECLSDVTKQFRSANNVNYQDPNYAVQLPIFSIHGNHDDPSRDQGGGDLLAALGENTCVCHGGKSAYMNVQLTTFLPQ